MLSAACLLMGCSQSPAGTGTDEEEIKLDFPELARDLKARGYDAVIAEAEKSSDPLRQKLAIALRGVRTFAEEDPDQLWFQLQARTRLKGWEAIQEELLKQIPPDTLVAETSQLDSVRPAVHRLWRLGNRQIAHLSWSSNRKELFCGLHNGEFLVIDPATAKTVRRLQDLGTIFTTVAGPQGRDQILTQGFGRGGVKYGIMDTYNMTAVDGEKGKAIADLGMLPINSHRRPFVLAPTAPGVVATQDGRHLIVPAGESTFQVVPIEAPAAGQKRHFFAAKTNLVKDAVVVLSLVRDEGRQLATVDHYGWARTFSLPDGEELHPPRRIIEGQLGACAASADGRRVAVCTIAFNQSGKELPGTVAVWDLDERKVVFSHVAPGFRFAAVDFWKSPDVVVAGDLAGNISLWSAASDKPLSTVSAHREQIVRLVSAPEQGRVLSASFSGELAWVDPEEKEPLATPLTGAAARVAVSLDGRREALFNKKKLLIREVASGKAVHEITFADAGIGGIGMIHTVALDTEDGSILIGGDGLLARWTPKSKQAEVIPIDMQSVPADMRLVRKKRPYPIVVSPRGRHVVIWSEKHLAVFDPRTGQRRALIASNVRFLERNFGFYDNDDRLLIEYEGSPPARGAREFDLAAGKETADHVHGDVRFLGVGFATESGQFVTSGATRSGPNLVMVRDLKSGQRDQFELPQDQFMIGVSPNGQRMLTIGGPSATIFVWDLPAKRILKRFDLEITSPATSFDGHTVRIAESSSERRHMFRFHPAASATGD
jgi:WD40 repeat protein